MFGKPTVLWKDIFQFQHCGVDYVQYFSIVEDVQYYAGGLSVPRRKTITTRVLSPLGFITGAEAVRRVLYNMNLS